MQIKEFFNKLMSLLDKNGEFITFVGMFFFFIIVAPHFQCDRLEGSGLRYGIKECVLICGGKENMKKVSSGDDYCVCRK